MTELLTDSSFLYALYSTSNRYHAGTAHFAEENTGRLVVPDVILPEVVFLLNQAKWP